VVVNFSNYPAEVIENESPLHIAEYGFLPDSGAPACTAAGLPWCASTGSWNLEPEATLQIRADRPRFPAYGLAGGGPGRLCRTLLNPGRGERLLPAKTLLTIPDGDVSATSWRVRAGRATRSNEIRSGFSRTCGPRKYPSVMRKRRTASH